MTPQTVDLILQLTALGLRFMASIRKQQGFDKLASELEATAADTDAFRSDPVMRSEIESGRLSHTW